MKTLRLFLDQAHSPAWNMAVDEVLAQTYSPGADYAGVLRFYRWSRPAVSCGYFQDVHALARRFSAGSKAALPVVRRLTGGGLVVHGRDLTYSLVLPLPNPFFSGDVKTSYLKINEALRRGLSNHFSGLDYADCKTIPSGRARGERVCFESPSCYDLLLSGKKVVGASQRRFAKTLLHQSAIFLEETPEKLISLILEGFRSSWQVTFEEKPLTQEETRKAKSIETTRYVSGEWIHETLNTKH